MTNKNCRLIESGIIFSDNEDENIHQRIPKPELYTNIPMLWKILDSIDREWYQSTRPFQRKIDVAESETEKIYQIGQAFYILPAQFLKCLFSYVMFFISLEKAYDLFYKELNSINKIPIIRVSHKKPPKRNEFIIKVNAVRNISIVHLGSTDVPQIDSKAAMSWLPLVISKNKDNPWRVDQFSFGSGRLQVKDSNGNIINQSIDLEIKNIPEMHTKCMEYIDEYDETCATYLINLADKMPIVFGNVSYSYINK